ncbi:MAG TPA: electron transfer flavoprotein subunit alpha/FixB family protein [Nitrososphaerales archaeon]|nr:electron transfer flavoprotein subunit alpha/FixB family protein [Nitrososphaerales archaeon]
MTFVVWAYSEAEGVANEVASAADEIAKSVSGSAAVIDLDQERPGVSSPGRKLVLKASSPLADSPELAAEAIFRAAKAAGPSAVLLGATRRGREVASRLAVKMKVGCVSEVFRLKAGAEELQGERNMYAGKFLSTVACRFPCVATLKTGVLPRLAGRQGSVDVIDLGALSPKVRLLGRAGKKAGTVDLKSAKVIVSAGRGVKKKEDLQMIDELARSLGGVLGCSRPLSSDLGWLPEEHHIGLTGLEVHPNLYLAVGISGQLQHIAGIKDSKIIAAINTDKDAPIFQAADYGVVGDLYQIVPAIKKLVSGG